MQAKRGGGGHIAGGLASITGGSLALECPACPHPGRNLPQGWDEVSEDKKYVCPSCYWNLAESCSHFLGGCIRISLQSTQISG